MSNPLGRAVVRAAERTEALLMKQGTITAVAERLCTVEIDNDSVPNVQTLDHVDPVVGAGCWVMMLGSGRWIIFGLRTTTPASYEYVTQIRHTAGSTLVFNKTDYPWLRAIRVRCQGAGGGGGGVVSTASKSATAAGGSGGHYAESFITDIGGLPDTTSGTRGTGGAGGAAGNNAGSDGGSSSFGILVVAPGGLGGIGDNADGALGTTAFSATSAATNGAPPTGQIMIHGQAGAMRSKTSATFAVGGSGGSSHLGTGGQGAGALNSSAAGGIGRGYGAGGGGAAGANHSTNRAGGSGSNGIVILDLFK